jgi:16S rRNA (adenine1518-N6/adenine1519-N6)-dimethyltransferase
MPNPKLTSPSGVRAWIAEREFLPSRVLGQNFLIDENILRIMVDAAKLCPEDRVLEIGPGLGIVTAPLIEQAEKVVAIEKDKRLFEHLASAFASEAKLDLICADALHAGLEGIIAEKRINKMVANLPYSVGSRIMVELFQLPRGLDTMVITVQLEVAERICAKVNTPDYGLLSIWAQLDYDARITKRISPSCFHPRPQVTSAIVTLQRTRDNRTTLRDARLFDRLIKHAFSKRRKQIGTILGGFHANGAAALASAAIDPMRRPETIEVREWIALADALRGA